MKFRGSLRKIKKCKGPIGRNRMKPGLIIIIRLLLFLFFEIFGLVDKKRGKFISNNNAFIAATKMGQIRKRRDET